MTEQVDTKNQTPSKEQEQFDFAQKIKNEFEQNKDEELSPQTEDCNLLFKEYYTLKDIDTPYKANFNEKPESRLTESQKNRFQEIRQHLENKFGPFGGFVYSAWEEYTKRNN
jgi:hypothetical protein